MSAYMIIDVDISDMAAYEEYKKQVPAIITKHGGEYVIRGGEFKVLEGDWQPTRMVMLKFPTMAAALAMESDPEYQPIKAIRHNVARSSIVVAEGL